MKKVSLPDLVIGFMTSVAPGPGVVAVSGGPDSVALTLLLASLQSQGLGPLTLAHLNHQLRAGESDADEQFVHDLGGQLAARGLAIQTRSQRFDVLTMAQEAGENLESFARRVRYDWLAQVAREHGAGWLATGHTADDQAETVLHRLLRGTGLHGLAGIPPRRLLAPGIDLVRPLLIARRSDILAYLAEENQPFRQDSSNINLGFSRNRLRHGLLPELARDYNPAIVPILCRLAEQARAVQDLIEPQAVALLKEAELPRAGNLLVFNAACLAGAPAHLVREMFRLVWQREHWPAAAMGFPEWDRLELLVHADEGAIDFPDGGRARRLGGVLQLGFV